MVHVLQGVAIAFLVISIITLAATESKPRPAITPGARASIVVCQMILLLAVIVGW